MKLVESDGEATYKPPVKVSRFETSLSASPRRSMPSPYGPNWSFSPSAFEPRAAREAIDELEEEEAERIRTRSAALSGPQDGAVAVASMDIVGADNYESNEVGLDDRGEDRSTVRNEENPPLVEEAVHGPDLSFALQPLPEQHVAPPAFENARMQEEEGDALVPSDISVLGRLKSDPVKWRLVVARLFLERHSPLSSTFYRSPFLPFPTNLRKEHTPDSQQLFF